MDKLIFYALSSPEKLDRIGTYLARKLTRFVDRKRQDFVRIAMEALDLLLMACHAPNLNLFVESFLRMVQKLVESPEVDLQVLGTASFVKFANIEEDTPSYHRRYDFFVSKFSSMCWYSGKDEHENLNIRAAGLRGLQGVVRKTISDDLQINIWDSAHMAKIVPSLLFILEERERKTSSRESGEFSGNSTEDPTHLAEACLRELMSRASFGNIKAVINPTLVHIDASELWVPTNFALNIFKIIMYSVQNQYNHVVIQMLLSHLDNSADDSAKKKTGIVCVLSACVKMASGASIGPAVLEVFSTLLRHLRSSVDVRFTSKLSKSCDEDEKDFEESLVTTIGAFAALLPDFQKSDIMMFIMGKFPMPSQHLMKADRNTTQLSASDTALQKMLLHSLLKVSDSFNPTSLSAAFPPSFIEAIFQATIVENPEARRLALEVIYTLLDRHGNIPKLGLKGMLKRGQEIELCAEKCSKQDLMFFRKYHDRIFWYLYESACMRTNSVDNILAIYLTLAILSTEVTELEVISELISLSFGFQNISLKEDVLLPSANRCALHGVTAAQLHLAAQLLGLSGLGDHVTEVIHFREKEAPYLVPEKAFTLQSVQLSTTTFGKHLLFSLTRVQDVLCKAGVDPKLVRMSYVHKLYDEMLEHSSSPESLQNVVSAVPNELDSHGASSGMRPATPKEHITFQMLKDIVADRSMTKPKNGESERQFNDASFAEIADDASFRLREFNSKLDNVLDVCATPKTVSALSISTISVSSIPVDDAFELKFPEQYVY
ncbi:hypothetical protein QZH41_001042 [Actinostola sp. cb2023]|nr:hypothetical protein QZH41_001042 [Actinostola sp. cb2023]